MPEKWAYMFDDLDAMTNFSYQITPVCFHGHTHVPIMFRNSGRVNLVRHAPARIVGEPVTVARKDDVVGDDHWRAMVRPEAPNSKLRSRSRRVVPRARVLPRNIIEGPQCDPGLTFGAVVPVWTNMTLVWKRETDVSLETRNRRRSRSEER